MNKEYYLLEGDERTGPFNYNEVVRKGLDIDTQIATSAIGEWHLASEIPEFIQYFESVGIYFPTGDNLASFGWRALAFTIDYIILCIPIEIILIQQGFIKLPTGPNFSLPNADEMMILQGSFFAAFLVYNTILESTRLKGSLGKKICKLIVVDIDGQNPSVLRVLGRNMGALLSLFIYGIPFLSMFFSEHKQTWYDSLTKAYVLKTNS